MSFQLIKGYPIHPQGLIVAEVAKIWMEKNCEVKIKEKKRISDLIWIEFATEFSKITQRYFPIMEEDTELGKVVKAITGGYIPDRIDDPEEFFVGKEVKIEVKHNKSRDTGRKFANVASVYPLEEEDDESDDDDDFSDKNTEYSDKYSDDDDLDVDDLEFNDPDRFGDSEEDDDSNDYDNDDDDVEPDDDVNDEDLDLED
ncbi:hypothetical protein [Brevibacillus sp. FSL K6-2834]|uniref:hypothetical protein n=1 Tax=Brevibacillus sp. FSL K6-2834 TaxID=2954680 RepID=UPI003158FEF5